MAAMTSHANQELMAEELKYLNARKKISNHTRTRTRSTRTAIFGQLSKTKSTQQV